MCSTVRETMGDSAVANGLDRTTREYSGRRRNEVIGTRLDDSLQKIARLGLRVIRQRKRLYALLRQVDGKRALVETVK